MDIINETTLRTALLCSDTKEYRVAEGIFVTPLAMEFLNDRGIRLIRVPYNQNGEGQTMTATPIPENGDRTYVDLATGRSCLLKEEYMTQLKGNLLVHKKHPRIAFRGKLDSIQADIICIENLAYKNGENVLLEQLEEVLACIHLILAGEVKDTPLLDIGILGMTPEELRYISHHIQEEIGISHPIPHYKMGEIALRLNYLRTQVRECELFAINAFCNDKIEGDRPDIILALNRLSSGIYIMFCRFLAQKSK